MLLLALEIEVSGGAQKWILSIALSLIVIGASTITIIWACGGSPRPSCSQSAWLGKVVTGVVIVPPGATTADVNITLIPGAFWTVTPDGAVPACAVPIGAEIVLTVAFPGIPVQTFTVPAPIPVSQGAQPPITTTITVTLPVFTPAAGPPVVAALAGSYNLTFGGGVGAGLVSGLGPAEICFVNPSPLDPNVPRLDMKLVTPVDTPYQLCQRGDETHSWYVICNNDPECAVELNVTATSTQIARMPGGTAEGRFSISSPDPNTDSFFISLGDNPFLEGDILDPNDPVNGPATTTLTIPALGVAIIKANIGIHGMCADGSCGEQLTKVEGVWIKLDGSTEPALACAQTVIIVDNNAPAKLPLCDIIDSVRTGPGFQCAWESAFFDDDPHLSTLPGRDNLNVPLDQFITFGQDPPILSSLTAAPIEIDGVPIVGSLPQQTEDILRVHETPHSIRYVMDCTSLTAGNQVRNHVEIHGFENLPPGQMFDVPFFSNGTNNIPNLDIIITIPENLTMENPNINVAFGENQAFNGDFFELIEVGRDFIQADLGTGRSFTKLLPSAEDGGGLLLGVGPSEAVALLPNGATGPLFDVFDQFSGDPLPYSATSDNPLFTPDPATTLDAATLEVTLDTANIPEAPGVAIGKIVVENQQTFNKQKTILVASRTLPSPVIQDTDGDGVADDLDNAVCVINPDQRDTNGDGIANIVDPDLDDDGVVGVSDFNIFRGSFSTNEGDANYNEHADFDGDGTVGIGDFNVMRALFNQPIDRFALCPDDL